MNNHLNEPRKGLRTCEIRIQKGTEYDRVGGSTVLSKTEVTAGAPDRDAEAQVHLVSHRHRDRGVALRRVTDDRQQDDPDELFTLEPRASASGRAA